MHEISGWYSKDIRRDGRIKIPLRSFKFYVRYVRLSMLSFRRLQASDGQNLAVRVWGNTPDQRALIPPPRRSAVRDRVVEGGGLDESRLKDLRALAEGTCNPYLSKSVQQFVEFS